MIQRTHANTRVESYLLWVLRDHSEQPVTIIPRLVIENLHTLRKVSLVKTRHGQSAHNNSSQDDNVEAKACEKGRKESAKAKSAEKGNKEGDDTQDSCEEEAGKEGRQSRGQILSGLCM